MVRSKGQLWEGGRELGTYIWTSVNCPEAGERVRERERLEKKVGSRVPRQPTIGAPLARPRCLCLLCSKLGDHGVAEAQSNLKWVTSPPSRPNLADDFIFFFRVPTHAIVPSHPIPSAAFYPNNSKLANKNLLVIFFPSFKVACGCYLVSFLLVLHLQMIVYEADMPLSNTPMIWTSIWKWYMVRCGSKN